jgi:hypothetical protein
MLKYNDNTYANEDVDIVSIVIKLGETASDNWQENEKYVYKKLKEIGLGNLATENPIDDFVFVQIKFANDEYIPNTNEDLELLQNVCNKIKKVFNDTKICVTCDELEEDFNEFDVTLEEFLNIWSVD